MCKCNFSVEFPYILLTISFCEMEFQLSFAKVHGPASRPPSQLTSQQASQLVPQSTSHPASKRATHRHMTRSIPYPYSRRIFWRYADVVCCLGDLVKFGVAMHFIDHVANGGTISIQRISTILCTKEPLVCTRHFCTRWKFIRLEVVDKAKLVDSILNSGIRFEYRSPRPPALRRRLMIVP